MKLSKLKLFTESEDIDLESFLINHVKFNHNNQPFIKQLLKNKDFVYTGPLYRVLEFDRGLAFMGSKLLPIKKIISNIQDSFIDDGRYKSWSSSLLGVKHFQDRLVRESETDSIYVIIESNSSGLDINKLIDYCEIKELNSYKKDFEVLSKTENFKIKFINGYSVDKFSTEVDRDSLGVASKLGSTYSKPKYDFTSLMSNIKAEKNGVYYALKISLNTIIKFKEQGGNIKALCVSHNCLDGKSWSIEPTKASLEEFVKYISEEDKMN